MALQSIIPPVPVGPTFFTHDTSTPITLDAIGEYTAWIIRAPRTGTIDRLHFRATTVTADGSGLRCRIETVNASDGLPSGTLVGGSAEVTVATTTADAWNRSGAGLAATVTKGDLIAVKLLSPAGTTFNGIIRVGTSTASYFAAGTGSGAYFPYRVDATPTAAKTASGLMHFALEYNDGVTPYIDGASPAIPAGETFNNSSTPDERGMIFQVPFPCRVIGLWSNATGGASAATFDLVLYDAANSVLASVSVDPDQTRLVGGAPNASVYPVGAVTLAKDTNYRLVCKPTSTTGVSLTGSAVDTTAGGTRLREATAPATWQKTSRVDAGSWTEVADSYYAVGLVLDQFDDGVGGGGGGLLTHPGMSGGARG